MLIRMLQLVCSFLPLIILFTVKLIEAEDSHSSFMPCDCCILFSLPFPFISDIHTSLSCYSTPVYWLSGGSRFRSFPEPFPLPTPLLLNCVQLLCRGQQSVTLWQVVYPPISYLSVCILTGCPPDDRICSPVFTSQILIFIVSPTQVITYCFKRVISQRQLDRISFSIFLEMEYVGGHSGL